MFTKKKEKLHAMKLATHMIPSTCDQHRVVSARGQKQVLLIMVYMSAVVHTHTPSIDGFINISSTYVQLYICITVNNTY